VPCRSLRICNCPPT